MGILGDFTGGTSYNGSQNSSWSAGNSNSMTYGSIASAQNVENMKDVLAWEEHMWEKAAAYNAEQARIQRDWQQAQVDVANQMANTTYSRSVKDMIDAGINPILAAGAGLGAVGNGTVAGGSSASIGSPTGHMAQAVPDVISSSQTASQGQGSSWGSSESGLAVGLQLLGEAIGSAISTLGSGKTLDDYMTSAGEKMSSTWEDVKEAAIENLPGTIVDALGLESTRHNSPNNRQSNESFSHKVSTSGTTTVSGRQNHSGGGTGF